MARRGVLGVSVAVLLPALAPAPGSASTVSIGSSGGQATVSYQASDGEVNDLSISFSSGVYTLVDPGATIQDPGNDCTLSNGSHTATCAATGGYGASLGDENDEVRVLTATPGGSISGEGGDDDVFGGPSPEDVDGGTGEDEIRTAGGNDRLDGDADDDILDGGEGSDAFETGVPVGGDTPISGGSDTITGGPGDDALGPPPSGYPPASDGPDDFSGGSGRDTVDYSRRTAPLSIIEDGAPGDGQAGEGDNIRGDVEVVLGGAANDEIAGSDADNAFDGRSGDDVLRGGGGNDTLEGGIGDAGSDTLDGGEGNDSLTGNAGDDGLDGGGGHDFLSGAGGADSLAGAGGDDSLLGGAGIDSLTGGDGNDSLRGGAPGLIGADGNDTLKGDGGADSLQGDEGDDTLNGGLGPDSLGGGSGSDTADYSDRFGGISVTLDDRPNDGARGERDNVSRDVENVRGGGFDDDLEGDTKTNVLQGGSGEDYADGGPGNDDLQGGGNGDVLRARDGLADRISCGGGADFVIADRIDSVSGDCDRVDAARTKRARLRRTAVVGPVKGRLRFSPTRIRRTVPLRDLVNVPLGSRVDASSGSVRLQAARSRRRQQSATLAAGLFQVIQSRGNRPRTDLVMRGGDFRKCASPPTRRAAASQRRRSRRVIRRLRTNARGRFRTRGRHSSATVRGTKYEVIDRCDGTLTRVTRGRVVVRDFRRRKTIVLRAGKSYLAKARR